MKCYLLLRDNKESGPYTLEELKALDLKANDLIWIEGNSTSWSYPTEMADLKPWVKKDEKSTQRDSGTGKTKRVFVSLPFSSEQKSYQRITETELHDEEPVLETRYCQSFDEMKALYAKRFQERKTSSFKRRKIDTRAAYWIAALFAGIICCAYIIKQMVDGFDNHWHQGEVATATAIPATLINPEAVGDKNTDAPAPGYQNAVATEVLPDSSIARDEIKGTPKVVSKNALTKITKPKNISKEVKVKSNNYHVGFFGGVQDLQLTITNNSDYLLDDVMVKVAFLKPNGQPVKEAIMDAKAIPAKASKTLEIPSSNRGIKVKYEIIKVTSKNYSKLLET